MILMRKTEPLDGLPDFFGCLDCTGVIRSGKNHGDFSPP
jgi:hypothetical protein